MENNCIFLSMYHLPSVCCTLVLEIHVCSEMLHVHVLWCIDVIHVNSKDWSYFIVGHEDEKWCTPRAALALENEYHCLPTRWCMFFPSTTLKIWYCTRCREIQLAMCCSCIPRTLILLVSSHACACCRIPAHYIHPSSNLPLQAAASASRTIVTTGKHCRS